jgi:tripartite-type tricarboxylate transporter receptor subunit TctC
MKILSAVFHVAIAAVLGLLAVAAPAQQNYPNKTIRIIVPFPPGASNDILARIVGKKLTDGFGVQTIVDNRPGASTIIGASALQKSPPDGYTLMVTSGTHLITPMLMPAPYDAVKDFTPVTTIDRSEYLLVVHPALPANNLKEFIALAKAKPGQLNYATSSIGSGNHISAVLLMERTGIKMQHVPYKGGGPAVTDLMAGQVQVFFNSPSSTLPYVQQGKLKAIAVTGEKRMTALPKVPTFTESGLPNFDVKSWHGILAPPGTPKPIVDTIAKEVAKILAMPDTIEQLASFGLGPFISTPEQFAAMMNSENERYGRVIKAAGIKGE